MKTGSIRHWLFAILIAGVIALPAAPCHAQGNVTCWGNNWWGQASVPGSLTGVRSIAAGGQFDRSFSVAVTASGVFVGWGDNSYGQSAPPQGLPAVKNVAAGCYGLTVVVTRQGHLISWGQTYELGKNRNYGTDFGGEWIYDGVPGDAFKIGGITLTGCEQVAAGHHRVIVNTAGEVMCLDDSVVGFAYGSDANGQPVEGSLGDPMQYRGSVISAARKVVAGQGFTGVLLADGRIAGFGGFSHYPPWSSMDPASGLEGVTDIAGNYDHMAAVLSNGTVVCLGSNRYGESLGSDSGGLPILSVPNGSPVQLGGALLTSAIKVAVGSDHTVALLASGNVVAWGRNNMGQCLGSSAAGPILGAATGQIVKVDGADITSITEIAAGYGHAVALIGTGVALECPVDLDASGSVDFGDVAMIMLEFGACADCPTDLDGTGMIDLGDVAMALLEFGPCS